MASEYSLEVIHLEELRWDHPLHSRMPDLYVELALGDVKRTTRTVKRSTSPSWDERLVFSSPDDDATLGIQVKHDSSWLSDPCVGRIEVKLRELMERSVEGKVMYEISPIGQGATTPTGRIALRLEAVDPMTAAHLNVDTAVEDIRQRGILSKDESPSEAKDTNQSNLYQAVGELLSKLEVFRDVGDTLSEIHPFVTVAWTVTSGLYDVTNRVFEVDKRLVDVVIDMRDAFTFVNDVQTLPDRASSLQGPVTGLLKQTIECCLFVRRYTSKTFFKRMLDTESSRKVNEFQCALAKLKEEIDSGMALHTAFVSTRTSEGINELLLQQRLRPSTSTTTFGRPVCFRETRLGARKQIIEWAFSDDSRKILWLYGVAGSGKGTVITTVANHLRDMCRLGAFLLFERSKSDPSSVIRTIAYKLALFDSSIGSRILSEIEKDKDIISASSQQQFDELLLQPLLATSNSIPGPIIIVLDGLDECGTPQSRYGLMQLLQRDFSKLPDTFRIILTSRQEPDINKALSSQPQVVHSMMLDYTSADSRNDVLSYLGASMRDAVTAQVEIPTEWPWDENMKVLSKAAGGLFVWASTAVNLVSVSDNPFHTLKDLVSDTRSVANFGLDQLYGTVLRCSGIAWSSEASRSRFRDTMALVLLSKAPLTSKSIDNMLGFPPEESSVLILSRLQSVLSYSSTEPINVFHASFADYLLSPDKSDDPWYIDASAANRLITEQCFVVMKNHLRFNICGLTSSFDFNGDVPNLADRVGACIPSHLVYACSRWAQHLFDIPYSSDICDKLSEFAYNRLLFWFETLSLIRGFGSIASPALRNAAGWVEDREDLASFLQDASKLATIFTFPIGQSATHVYVSMLPLSKDDSPVAAHYSKQFSSLVQIDRRGVRRPMMCLKLIDDYAGEVWSIASSPDGRRILSGTTSGYLRIKDFDSARDLTSPVNAHSSHVWSVGFSPDGHRIVSGSEDRTIKIHDAHTGRLIYGPLRDHSTPVRKVVFSSDGTKIASGSDDGVLILWDLGMDEKAEPTPLVFESKHVGGVLSLAFSSNDKRLVSGSCDKTVMIWDVVTRKPVLSPLVHRGDVYAVALAQDGQQILSVSADNTVRVWDIQGDRVVSTIRRRTVRRIVVASFSPCGTRVVVGFYDRSLKVFDMNTGDDVAGPFEGHTGAVTYAVMTTDRKYVVSSSQAKTVRIWDAVARTAHSRKLPKHTRRITSVVYSPDEKRIATASGDESAMIWDADSGEAVTGPFLGHSGPVNCLVFSPDGSRLFSGSDDGTTRVWDSVAGKEVFGPFKGHRDAVSCIALSPDGTRIASGSDDKTILVRDAETGELVAPPLDVLPASAKALAFYPDGKRLASCLSDRNVVIWDAETWKESSSCFLGQIGQVDCVRFSQDCSQVISGSRDGSVSIWGTESGHITAGPFMRHIQPVSSVCLSTDGKYLISCAINGMIRVWDVATKKTIRTLQGHSDEIRALALSEDCSRFVSGSKDRSVRIWDLSDLRHPVAAATRQRELEDSTRRDTLYWYVSGKGWLRGGPDERFVLWIPPDLRGTLWKARNTAVFSCEFSTELDFSNAAIGGRWAECYTPTDED